MSLTFVVVIPVGTFIGDELAALLLPKAQYPPQSIHAPPALYPGPEQNALLLVICDPAKDDREAFRAGLEAGLSVELTSYRRAYCRKAP